MCVADLRCFRLGVILFAVLDLIVDNVCSGFVSLIDLYGVRVLCWYFRVASGLAYVILVVLGSLFVG